MSSGRAVVGSGDSEEEIDLEGSLHVGTNTDSGAGSKAVCNSHDGANVVLFCTEFDNF